MTLRWIVICAFPLVTACGGLRDQGAPDGSSTDNSSEASGAADGVSATDSQTALAITVSSGATFVVDTSASATAAATAVVSTMTPSGCATQTTAANKVTYTFNDCSGPYGLVKVQGSLTATYTSTLKSISVALSSSDLKVGTTSLDLEGQATYTDDSTLVLAPSGSATTAAGNKISWSGSITVGWTSTCASLNGSYSFTVDGTTWSVSAKGYERCEASCPAAGGSLTLSGTSGSLTIAYDGTSSATYTFSGGSTGKLPLLCGS